MMAFDHMILSCIGPAARSGREIAQIYSHRQGVDPSPAVRIYTALPGLARRGWVAPAGKSGRATLWRLSAMGGDKLERWVRGPGGSPPSGRSVELLVTLACLQVPREDTAFLLRREIARVAAEFSDPLRSPPLPGGAPLQRRRQRRQGLAREVLEEWLKSGRVSACR
jgi:DNA-binding PadR family transcriptional regulator